MRCLVNLCLRASADGKAKVSRVSIAAGESACGVSLASGEQASSEQPWEAAKKRWSQALRHRG